MILFKKMKIKRLTKKLKGMHQYRQHNQPSDEILQKEIALYMSLSDIYKSFGHGKQGDFNYLMVNECLRAAASLDFPAAKYDLGVKLLDEAKFRDNIEKEVLFANSSNKRQAAQLFEEALVYLQSAENLGHALAKRLRGLCLINGWGVEADKDKGFELVLASIDQENSWDKVPQIFAAIGLNKPEFFSALGKHRGKNMAGN